jgi:hypothetical protein
MGEAHYFYYEFLSDDSLNVSIFFIIIKISIITPYSILIFAFYI